MSSLNFSLSPNPTSAHPPFFFISGFHNVPYAKYYYVFLCFVFVVSVLGNSFVMFIIYTESSLHTPKYMAIFSLAVADLGSSTAVIPNLVATFLFDSQYISFDACLANMFFVFYFNFIQSGTLTVLAYDRFVAIFLPLRYHSIITLSTMSVILAVVWAFYALFMMSCVALLTRLSFCKSIVIKSYFCDYGPTVQLACNDNSLNFIMGQTGDIFSLHLPLILIIASYLFIAGALAKISSWEGRFKAIKTCSAHLMLVAVYYLPPFGTIIASFAVIIYRNTWIISSSLAFTIPPMLNPIIYVLNTEEVRELSKKYFKRK